MWNLKWHRSLHTQLRTNSPSAVSERHGDFGLVKLCSRSRLYYSVHFSCVSTPVYFDSLDHGSSLHVQLEAVWRRTSQQAFAVCFAETSADHSSKHRAALAAVSHKCQQHTTTSPHGSKPSLCSCLLRSDSNSCIVSSSVTILRLTPTLSLLISHAKEKYKRSTHNVPNLPLYNPSD